MSNNKLSVIVLAGFTCAGKSTISKRLVDLYGFDLMEQYVIYRSIAMTKGYKRTRHWLAEVGNEIFIKETTLETVRCINSLADSHGVVIDASYGPAMDVILRSSLMNARIIMISVRSDQNVRAKRMAGRMGTSDEEAQIELSFRDDFLIEVNLEEVMEKADFEIVNKGNVEDIVYQIVDKLADFGILKP